MKRRRELLKNNIIPIPILDATAGDVVFSKNDGSEIIIIDSKSNWPVNDYTPIGVVVIPASHGVLKDGSGTINQCGIMSLNVMSCGNPQNGTTTTSYVLWGMTSVNVSGKSDNLNRFDSVTNGLKNYDYMVNFNSYLREGVYLPSTKESNTGQVSGDNISRYDNSYDSSLWGVSPYQSDGSYNTLYGTPELRIYSQYSGYDNGTGYNSLSDFSGIINTKILTDLHSTGLSNWKTSSSIENRYQGKTKWDSGNYYPAAACCARYKTIGTKSFSECTTQELYNGTGFWYFPASGELGYIIVRWKEIDDAIAKIKTYYSGIGALLSLSNSIGYRSSTEGQYSQYNCGTCYPAGMRSDMEKAKPYCDVRAFMRL